MEQGLSNIASTVDYAFWVIIAVSVALLVLVTFFMIFFAFKYSRRKNPEVKEIPGHLGLELFWTILPTIIVLWMFWIGYEGFLLMRDVPDDAVLVKVTARKWSWQFEYEKGQKSKELILEIGQPVKLALTAKDVLHSLFIPAFRVKEDVVPGQETLMWFVPEKVGTYDLFCTEYCGAGHSRMLSKVQVLSSEDFKKWNVQPKATKSKSARGLEVLNEQGCLGCHTTDGSELVGPSFKGIMGRRSIVLSDGKEHEVIVVEAYIRKSITQPLADIVKGFPPEMPEFALSDDEMTAVIAYFNESSSKSLPKSEATEKPDDIKTVKPTKSAPVKSAPKLASLLLPEDILAKYKCLGCHSLDGKRKIGPSFKGISGRSTTVLRDGKEHKIIVDEAYLRKSILTPKADVVKGFKPIMPTKKISTPELETVIMYLMRLKDSAIKESPAKEPEGLIVLKAKRCLGCHSIDGKRKVGPSFKGLFGRHSVVFTGDVEREIVADGAYIKRSILTPKADVVKGFKPIMPTKEITADEIAVITDYIKTLK